MAPTPSAPEARAPEGTLANQAPIVETMSPVLANSPFGLYLGGVIKDAFFGQYVFFDCQKTIQAGLQLQGDDCAERERNLVSSVFVLCF